MILSFAPEFVPAIRTGQKIHTLRDPGRWAVGNTIQFYDKMYQKDMYKFQEDGVVKNIQDVHITLNFGVLAVSIDDRYIYNVETRWALIRNDGFDSETNFIDYFFPKKTRQDFNKKTLDLIHWTDFQY